MRQLSNLIIYKLLSSSHFLQSNWHVVCLKDDKH